MGHYYKVSSSFRFSFLPSSFNVRSAFVRPGLLSNIKSPNGFWFASKFGMLIVLQRESYCTTIVVHSVAGMMKTLIICSPIVHLSVLFGKARLAETPLPHIGALLLLELSKTTGKMVYLCSRLGRLLHLK